MNQTAIDLVNRFKMVLMHEETECGNDILCTTIAKQCALICVDEILSINNQRPYQLSGLKETFYKQLKQEIQKL